MVVLYCALHNDLCGLTIEVGEHLEFFAPRGATGREFDPDITKPPTEC
jgi:hypothetical protein